MIVSPGCAALTAAWIVGYCAGTCSWGERGEHAASTVCVAITAPSPPVTAANARVPSVAATVIGLPSDTTVASTGMRPSASVVVVTSQPGSRPSITSGAATSGSAPGYEPKSGSVVPGGWSVIPPLLAHAVRPSAITRADRIEVMAAS